MEKKIRLTDRLMDSEAGMSLRQTGPEVDHHHPTICYSRIIKENDIKDHVRFGKPHKISLFRRTMHSEGWLDRTFLLRMQMADTLFAFNENSGEPTELSHLTNVQENP